MKYLIILMLLFPLCSQALLSEKKMDSGQLSDKDCCKLKGHLSAEDIKADLIVIIYYPGKDKCNGKGRVSTWNVFDRDFNSQLNKIAKNQQF